MPDKAQFRRPDKAKPPSGIAPVGNVRAVCRMALCLSGLRRFSNMGFPMPDKAKPPSGKGADGGGGH